jgi:hypothetical protein
VLQGTDSDDKPEEPSIPEIPGFGFPAENIGTSIDAAIEPPDKPLIDPEKLARTTLKTGPPGADEWLDFFSRIILKIGMDLYVDAAFRQVDEEKVSEADLQRIKVRKDERDTIARPFAEFAVKNPVARKHGRQIVALTDSIESLMTLGIWMRRVNRVAKKYQPPKQQKPRNIRIKEASQDGNRRPTQGNPGEQQASPNGSGYATGYSVYNPGSG